MPAPTAIREATDGDWPGLTRLYAAAFPEEDLLPLLAALHRERAGVSSLVAEEAGEILGHVCLTHCGIDGTQARLTLLGPLAVQPARQRRGIGTALVGEALSRERAAGVTHALVLGDPAYYRRFGFVPDARAAPPAPLPEAWRPAWQSLRLGAGEEIPSGPLTLPAPWLDPALWAP